MGIDSINGKLKKFFENNQQVELTSIELDGKPFVILKNPWGDPTVGFNFQEEKDELIEALNNITLPERLSAIYHNDTGNLEVIWTANRLSGVFEDIKDRKFDFVFGGKSHTCHFAESSERLKLIGRRFMPLNSSGDTNFRNLLSYLLYAEDNDSPDYVPYSFWIYDIETDITGEETVDLLRTLNFYLKYYDKLSPMVLIHPPSLEESSVQSAPRYTTGFFPDEIRASQIDPNIAMFWGSAFAERNVMRYLLLYRIIEYLSLEFVEIETRAAIKSILARPHVSSDFDGAVSEIMVKITQSKGKAEDVFRFNSLVKAAVPPDLIWPSIDANRDAFSKDASFDGGFVLDALINENDSLKTFGGNGVESFSRSIRKLRNALSHGRDSLSAGVISPTARNMQLLAPWLQLLEIAAGEVVIRQQIP